MTRRLPRISKALAVASGAIGLWTVLAWIAGHPELLRPFGGMATRCNAGIVVVLTSAALWVLGPEGAPSTRRRAARVLAGLVVAFTVATLLEYALSIDLGLDQVLVREPLGEPGTLPPGRMAPAAAVAFACLGIALLVLDRGTRLGRRPAELLAVLSFIVGFVGVTDFAYGHHVLRAVGAFRDMPLATALLAMALSLAVLFARPAVGIMGVLSEDAAGGGLVRRLLPAILLIPALVGWLRLRGEDAGFFDAAFGTSLMVTTTVLLLGAALLWKAHSLNASDHRQRALSEERARIAEQLKHANDFLDAIVENLPFMVFMKDAQRLTFVRFNRAGERLLGLSREALLGKNDYDFFPPDQAAHFQAKDRQTLASGAVVDLEEPIETATGRRWLHTKKVGLAGLDGKPAFLLGISEDITERRAQDEAVRKWAHVFEHAHWGIAVVSGDGGALEVVNPTFAAMHGYGVHELQGHAVIELVAPEDRQAASRHMATAADSGEQTFQVMRLRKDGSRFPALVNISVVKDDAGKIMFRAASVQDISNIRDAEDELRRAKNAAEATSRELEAFSYSVSHDLRAPLRSIDGFSQALLEDHGHHLDDTARQHLDRVRGAAQRMADLIDDLLDLSRVTRAELQRRLVDLSEVAREVAATLVRDDPERQIRFLIADGLQTMGDPRLIRLLFENLLGNAWKFTSRRATATIEVGRGADADGGHFFVRDDGAGFDMAYVDKLFGAFQRLHRESEFEGTGIGLATVQRIVLRHGGRIWAEGAVGAGATFRFTLSP